MKLTHKNFAFFQLLFLIPSTTIHALKREVFDTCSFKFATNHTEPDPQFFNSASNLQGFKTPEGPIKFVLDYYKEIDSGDLEAVSRRFSDDVVYIRFETPLVGKKALLDFYVNKRSLKGSHYVTSISIEKSSGNSYVKSVGFFVGASANKEIILHFEDLWWFQAGKMIANYRISNGRQVLRYEK